MPHIHIATNIPRDQFDQQFIDNMVSEIAVINGKPEKLFIVSLSCDQIFYMNKTQSPATHLAFLSIGKIDEDLNEKYSAVFFRMLNSIGIPNERIQLTFHDISKQNFAWNGLLVSKLFPDKPSEGGNEKNTSNNNNKQSSTCSIL